MVYEIIWESGEHSLANYDSEEEMLSAVAAHHNRAKSGEKAGPAGGPATRVAKVFAYKSDPTATEDSLSADVLKAELAAAVDDIADENGVVALGDLFGAVQKLRSSTVASGPHESNYKVKEDKTFTIADIEKAA